MKMQSILLGVFSAIILAFIPADIEDSYHFDYELKMTITNYDADGNAQEMPVTMFYPKSGKYMAAQTSQGGQGGTMIMDHGANKMITFMQQRAIIIPMDQYKQSGLPGSSGMPGGKDEENVDLEDVSFEKTGSTKTIAGYECQQYKVESADQKGEMWLTKELPFSFKESFMSMQQSFDLENNMEEMDGFPMEVNTTDKTSGEKFKMVVSEVNEKATSYKMSDYDVMDMGNMGGDK